MLRVNNISKSFGSAAILEQASFLATPSLLTIIEGQNGAGKSTLFNVIIGLVQPDDGEILLGDINLAAMPAIERAHYVAILKQDPKASTIPAFSVLDNFALALQKARLATLRKAASSKVMEVVRSHLASLQIDFGKDLQRTMSDFSGGQRQILAFAMATINKPRLLLLDEPSAALDDKTSHQLMRLVKRLIQLWQIPAVMISHDHDLNRQYGDEIWVLEEGKIKRTTKV